MDYRHDLLIRISELYYYENMNQQEIAKIHHLSRPTVSRILDEAKQLGIVEIKVHSPVEKNNALANAVRKKFDLREVVVVKGDFDFKKGLQMASKAAALFLPAILENNQIVGTSWGRALRLLAQEVAPGQHYNINFTQMVGCLGTGNPLYDGFEISHDLSKKFNGTYTNIYAPLYVDSKLVYSYLVAEPQIQNALNRVKKADVAISGIGSLVDNESTIQQAGYYTEKDRLNLLSKNAVGHVLGRMYDINGTEISVPNRYIISAELSDFKNANWSIGISAGKKNAESVMGTLNGGFFNMYFMDEALAIALLDFDKNQ